MDIGTPTREDSDALERQAAALRWYSEDMRWIALGELADRYARMAAEELLDGDRGEIVPGLLRKFQLAKLVIVAEGNAAITGKSRGVPGRVERRVQRSSGR